MAKIMGSSQNHPESLFFFLKDKQNLNANIHPLHHNFSKVQTNQQIIFLKELLKKEVNFFSLRKIIFGN